LLAAIGIAGMDRALQANIIAKSGKAVETAGDVDTVLLDKTGTITVGNRHAREFIPVGNFLQTRLAQLAALASTADETPEGKSIVRAAEDHHSQRSCGRGNRLGQRKRWTSAAASLSDCRISCFERRYAAGGRRER
jgi:high-affinity K+ transport system ATPase subunit B